MCLCVPWFLCLLLWVAGCLGVCVCVCVCVCILTLTHIYIYMFMYVCSFTVLVDVAGRTPSLSLFSTSLSQP